MDVDWDRVPPRYERGPAGRIRPLWRGVFLTVVTLGLYHFWWHLRTHHELMVFTSRRNHLNYLGLTYVVSSVVAIGFVLFLILPAAVDYEQKYGEPPLAQPGDAPIDQPTPTTSDSHSSPTPDSKYELFQFLDFLKRMGLLAPFLTLFALHSLIFGTFVALQHRALYQHMGPTHRWGKDASFFLGLYWGSSLISWLIPFSELLKLFSYYSLQDTYNRFWTEIQQGPSPVPLPVGDDTTNPVDDAQGL